MRQPNEFDQARRRVRSVAIARETEHVGGRRVETDMIGEAFLVEFDRDGRIAVSLEARRRADADQDVRAVGWRRLGEKGVALGKGAAERRCCRIA